MDYHYFIMNTTTAITTITSTTTILCSCEIFSKVCKLTQMKLN